MTTRRVDLLAMAPGGEACLVRQLDGTVWVSSIYRAPHEIEATDADQYIASHDFTRIDESFPTWEALEEYRNQRATAPADTIPQIADLSADDILDLIDASTTANNDEQRTSAQLLLMDILRYAHAVHADKDLRDAVIARMRELVAHRPRWEHNRDPEEFNAAMIRNFA